MDTMKFDNSFSNAPVLFVSGSFAVSIIIAIIIAIKICIIIIRSSGTA